MNNLHFYCEKFSKLKVSNSRKRGNAQYKPILLLTVIDLIMREEITDNKIFVSDKLIQAFNKYWNVIGSQSYKAGHFHSRG
jgi:putative restriction endonuclease